MNGSAGNKASGAPEKRDGAEPVLSLTTVHRMLPLVQRIVADVLGSQEALDRLLPEQDRLDRKRRSLAWPERQRRYQVSEDVAAADRRLQEALAELQELGVSLLDPELGRVGFPTIVNDRRAFFSWRPGEESLRHWHFAGENVCRIIPAAWLSEITMSSKN